MPASLIVFNFNFALFKQYTLLRHSQSVLHHVICLKVLMKVSMRKGEQRIVGLYNIHTTKVDIPDSLVFTLLKSAVIQRIDDIHG
ncbi:hypothetical protein KUL152_26630 [Tenacibaculum sp. KUL152]|nr:hypothetical protein KUL152_26630 [Tenacibaculum sp. KUL152]